MGPFSFSVRAFRRRCQSKNSRVLRCAPATRRQTRFYGSNRFLGDLILQPEDVSQFAVVTVAPVVIATDSAEHAELRGREEGIGSAASTGPDAIVVQMHFLVRGRSRRGTPHRHISALVPGCF